MDAFDALIEDEEEAEAELQVAPPAEASDAARDRQAHGHEQSPPRATPATLRGGSGAAAPPARAPQDTWAFQPVAQRSGSAATRPQNAAEKAAAAAAAAAKPDMTVEKFSGLRIKCVPRLGGRLRRARARHGPHQSASCLHGSLPATAPCVRRDRRGRVLSSVVVEERLRELRVLRLAHIRCAAARSNAAREPACPRSARGFAPRRRADAARCRVQRRGGGLLGRGGCPGREERHQRGVQRQKVWRLARCLSCCLLCLLDLTRRGAGTQDADGPGRLQRAPVSVRRSVRGALEGKCYAPRAHSQRG